MKTLVRAAGIVDGTGSVYRPSAALLMEGGRLLARNVNPKIVREMLGHANISQTMDTCSHVLPSMQETAASAMQEALG